MSTENMQRRTFEMPEPHEGRLWFAFKLQRFSNLNLSQGVQRLNVLAKYILPSVLVRYVAARLE
jgi:hypothetical protein